jgi:hypothetical protein
MARLTRGTTVTRRATAAVLGAAALMAVPAAAGAQNPRLVGVTVAEHGRWDRTVFTFRGGLPATRTTYVGALIQDGSGARVAVPGRAILEVRMTPAEAHDAAGSPTAPAVLSPAGRNLMRVQRSGDFEGYVTYGLGLAVRRPFRVGTLRSPFRVVVDVDGRYPGSRRRVWFQDLPAFQAGRRPDVRAVWRRVPAVTPATGVMDRLFAGPTTAEARTGLRLVRSGATGFRSVSIGGGVARVRLAGGCNGGGSTFTIANLIDPSMRQFPTVSAVKILDPAGNTGSPTGTTPSLPACLEP